MDTDITQQAKDSIQKFVCGLFKDTTLEFYGINTAKIKESINVELPIVEVSMASMDYVFLLEDNTYLHLEFQSTYKKKDLLRFLHYDIHLYERDNRDIRTVVIYTANVKGAVDCLKTGSNVYSPDIIMLSSYDENMLYSEIEEKINTKQPLKDIDIINLTFLPLMNNSIPVDELTIKSMKLAEKIPDKTKRNTCLASIYTLTKDYLGEVALNILLEVLNVNNVLVDRVAEGIYKGRMEGKMEGKMEEKIEVAKNALKKSLDIDTIKDLTGLTIEEIQELQAELDNQ